MSDLELAAFYFSSLRDFAKAIDKVEAMGALEDQAEAEIRFYYSALTLKGQALLHLSRDQEAVALLGELERTIAHSPKQVPYGDEFNFLNEMAQRNLEPEWCKQLSMKIVNGIKDEDFWNKFLSLLKELDN